MIRQRQLSSPPGDVNNDGVFDSADLVAIFKANEYEDGVEANSTWSEGDFNGDGEFDSADLVYVFSHGSYVAAATSNAGDIDQSLIADDDVPQDANHEDGIAGNSMFEEGEWHSDQEFDSGEIVLAFQAGTHRTVASARVRSVAAETDFDMIPLLPNDLQRVCWLGRF